MENRFFFDARDRSPVIDYIDKSTKDEQAKIRNVMRLLTEFGPNLGMPHAKQIKGKFWELRPGGIRLFYFLYFKQKFVILHGYRKQAQKAPRQEIDLATKRMNDLIEEVEHD